MYYQHTDSMLLSDIITKSKLLRVTALMTKPAGLIIKEQKTKNRNKNRKFLS